MNELSKTRSLCPECLKNIEATIFEENGKVFIKKTCPEHGEVQEVYWEDYEMYEKAKKWADKGIAIENPNRISFNDCPKDCGLCSNHKTHTCLGNIVVTNRCDLRCWYCFFYAQKMGYVYEPTLDQIRQMLRTMKNQKPVGSNAVQFTGGNPEVRDDFVEIIRIAKEEGFEHIQPNMNGTYKLWKDPNYAINMRKAGASTIYMSFDGTTPQTNPKNHWEIPYILDNCRKANLSIMLVPTVIKGINDQNVGEIVKFSIANKDIIRGVNFQPVSLVGRISKADRENMRITIPGVIKEIEKQTDGMIKKEDWYSIPVTTAITNIIEALKGKKTYRLSPHFACGMSTFIYISDDGEVTPFPRFIDVDGLITYLNKKAKQVEEGRNKLLVTGEIVTRLRDFVDKEKQPEGFNFVKIMTSIIADGDYAALGELMKRVQMLGMMHFQDLYNYDIERVKRCAVHYSQPDGSVVPFCAFNVLPELYRDKIQRQYAVSIEDWQRTHGNLENVHYVRDTEKLASSELYKKTYEGFI